VHQRNAEFELFHFLRTFQQCIFIKRTDEQTANERTEKGTIFSLRSLVTLSREGQLSGYAKNTFLGQKFQNIFFFKLFPEILFFVFFSDLFFYCKS